MPNAGEALQAAAAKAAAQPAGNAKKAKGAKQLVEDSGSGLQLQVSFLGAATNLEFFDEFNLLVGAWGALCYLKL